MKQRVGAFESVYALLYVWALFNAVYSLFQERENTELLTSAATGIIALAIFVGVVFLRNYHVLHEMDQLPSDREEALNYVDKLPRSHQLLERQLRLTMILLILLMPKNLFLYDLVFEPIYNALQSLSNEYVASENGVPLDILLPVKMAKQLCYHAFVMILLFAVMYGWDINSLCGLKKISKNKTICHENKVSVLNQFLDYINREDFSDRMAAMLASKKKLPLFRWYVMSPKFGERTSGFICAVSIVLIGLAKSHIFVLIVGVVSFAVYVVFASQNEGYFKSLRNLLTEPISYLSAR